MIKINSFSSKSQVDTEVMDRIGSLLTSMTKPVLLLLSGGSWLSFNSFALQNQNSLNLTITMLDERFTEDKKVNNYAQLQASPLLGALQIFHPHMISTFPQGSETIEEFTQRFELSLRGWKTTYPEGKIIACQGFGSDCHTAGIMPFPENPSLFEFYFEDQSWVCGYDATGKNPFSKRVTVTNTFLRLVDKSIVYLVGEEKQTAFEKMKSSEINLASFPCQIVQMMQDVEVFTDRT